MNTLSPAEVGDIFGVSEYQAKERARKQQWPHLKVGRRVRFTDEHVRQIAQLHEVAVRSDLKASRSWGRKTKKAS